MNVKVDECQGGQLVWWTYVGWMDVGLLSVGWMDVLEPVCVPTTSGIDRAWPQARPACHSRGLSSCSQTPLQN